MVRGEGECVRDRDLLPAMPQCRLALQDEPVNDTPRVALITGAARRIGAVIARRLHADGYAVAVHYRGSEAEAKSLAGELETARPGSTLLLRADLDEFDRLPELVAKTIGRFGRLDALVNNASTYYATKFGTATPAQWDELFNANARAPFFLAQAAAPHLQASKGAIVNIADLYALHPTADLSVHAASKAALVSLTQSLALALAPHVRVNAIAPGAILWPDAEDDTPDGDRKRREGIVQRTPLARAGTAEDIADTVAWLLESAGFVTGQVIRVDGGRNIAG